MPIETTANDRPRLHVEANDLVKAEIISGINSIKKVRLQSTSVSRRESSKHNREETRETYPKTAQRHHSDAKGTPDRDEHDARIKQRTPR